MTKLYNTTTREDIRFPLAVKVIFYHYHTPKSQSTIVLISEIKQHSLEMSQTPFIVVPLYAGNGFIMKI